jgi:SRSO17 transposase
VFCCHVDILATVLGYADRVEPLREYCAGLLLPGERKSVEPMAAVVAHRRVAAKHRSLLHFLGESAWSDKSPAIEARGFRRGRKAVAGGSAGQT